MTADFAADRRVSSMPRAITGAKQFLAQGIELANLREFERAIAQFTQAIHISLAILKDLPIPDPINRSRRHYSVTDAEVADIEITATQSFYHRGCTLCKVERYEGAIADFTYLIGQPPTSSAIPANWLITKLTEIYIHRGNAYRRLGQHARALLDLNQGVVRSDGSAQSYSCRGLVHLDMGDFEAAIADFDQALLLHPTFAQGYLWRGFARLRQGHMEAAIADLNRAIAAIPTCAEAFNHRGLAYFYLGDLQQARIDFSQAIQLDPAFAEAYNNRGNVLQLLGDAAAAQVDYDQAITHDAELAELYFNRAASDDDGAIAIADYDTTENLPVENAAFYRHRARVKRDGGQVEDAIADYTTAIAITPTAHALHQRGKLYLACAENEKALADFDQAVEQSPDYGKVYGDRAQLHFKHHALAASLADVDQAIELCTEPSRQLYSTRCLINFSLGHHQQALKDFEQLIVCIQRSSLQSSSPQSSSPQSSSQTSKDSTSIGSVGG